MCVSVFWLLRNYSWLPNQPSKRCRNSVGLKNRFRRHVHMVGLCDACVCGLCVQIRMFTIQSISMCTEHNRARYSRWMGSSTVLLYIGAQLHAHHAPHSLSYWYFAYYFHYLIISQSVAVSRSTAINRTIYVYVYA